MVKNYQYRFLSLSARVIKHSELDGVGKKTWVGHVKTLLYSLGVIKVWNGQGVDDYNKLGFVQQCSHNMVLKHRKQYKLQLYLQYKRRLFLNQKGICWTFELRNIAGLY